MWSFWDRSFALNSEDGALGISEFFVAAVVAALVDEFLGRGKVILWGFPWISFFAEEQTSAVKVDVGHVQPHRAAFGNIPRFVQVGPCAVGVAL